MSSHKKRSTVHQGFKALEYIVYPAHGVGQIVTIEEQEVAGHKLELFVLHFEKDKMHVKVPVAKALSIGMRKLSQELCVDKALEILHGRARIKRTMWSRRAQEYEAKINSGELFAIAEVVRDLFRAENQPDQSYSERQLYEVALDRLMREISAVLSLEEKETLLLIEQHLCYTESKEKAPRAAEKAPVKEVAKVPEMARSAESIKEREKSEEIAAA